MTPVSYGVNTISRFLSKGPMPLIVLKLKLMDLVPPEYAASRTRQLGIARAKNKGTKYNGLHKDLIRPGANSIVSACIRELKDRGMIKIVNGIVSLTEKGEFTWQLKKPTTSRSW